MSGVTSLSVLGHFVQRLGTEEGRGAGTRSRLILNVPWAYPFAGAGFIPWGCAPWCPHPLPAQTPELKDGGLFSTRALPLSPGSTDLYIRSGLELDSSKMSQVVSLVNESR